MRGIGFFISLYLSWLIVEPHSFGTILLFLIVWWIIDWLLILVIGIGFYLILKEDRY